MLLEVSVDNQNVSNDDVLNFFMNRLLKPNLPQQAPVPSSPSIPNVDVSKYLELAQQAPTLEQHKPSWLRRLGSMSIGAEYGPQAQEQYLNIPYAKAYQDWAQKLQGLQTAAMVPSELGLKGAQTYEALQRGQAELQRGGAESALGAYRRFLTSPQYHTQRMEELGAMHPIHPYNLQQEEVRLQQILADPETSPEIKESTQKELDSLQSTKTTTQGVKTPFQLWRTDPKAYEEWVKASAKNRPGMQVYAMVRLMDQIYKYNPSLAPMIPDILKKAGIEPPQGVDFSAIPEGQPLSEEGKPIGLAMPEAPTPTIRTRGQMAEDVISQLPKIESFLTNEEKLGKLGPIMGRWQEFLSGKYGADDPDYRDLRNNLETLASAFSRYHLNTEAGLKPFFDMMDAGKMTPDNIRSAVNSVRSWSESYKYTGSGRHLRLMGAPPVPKKDGKFVDGAELLDKDGNVKAVSRGGKWMMP